ncbi:MAG: hypothetical protein MHM6MM_004980 [Cercozoa sp. M6MM]
MSSEPESRSFDTSALSSDLTTRSSHYGGSRQEESSSNDRDLGTAELLDSLKDVAVEEQNKLMRRLLEQKDTELQQLRLIASEGKAQQRAAVLLAENADLRRRVEQLRGAEKARDVLTVQVEELQQHSDELARALEKQAAEPPASAQVDSILEEKQRIEGDLTQLKDDLAFSRKELEIREIKAAEAREKAHRLEQENAALKTEVQTLKSEQSEERVAKLKLALSSMDALVEEHAQENNDLRTRLNESEEARNRLQERVQVLESDVQQASRRQDLREALERVQTVESALGAAEERCTALEKAKQEADQRALELSQTVHKYERDYGMKELARDHREVVSALRLSQQEKAVLAHDRDVANERVLFLLKAVAHLADVSFHIGEDAKDADFGELSFEFLPFTLTDARAEAEQKLRAFADELRASRVIVTQLESERAALLEELGSHGTLVDKDEQHAIKFFGLREASQSILRDIATKLALIQQQSEDKSLKRLLLQQLHAERFGVKSPEEVEEDLELKEKLAAQKATSTLLLEQIDDKNKELSQLRDDLARAQQAKHSASDEMKQFLQQKFGEVQLSQEQLSTILSVFKAGHATPQFRAPSPSSRLATKSETKTKKRELEPGEQTQVMSKSKSQAFNDFVETLHMEQNVEAAKRVTENMCDVVRSLYERLSASEVEEGTAAEVSTLREKCSSLELQIADACSVDRDADTQAKAANRKLSLLLEHYTAVMQERDQAVDALWEERQKLISQTAHSVSETEQLTRLLVDASRDLAHSVPLSVVRPVLQLNRVLVENLTEKQQTELKEFLQRRSEKVGEKPESDVRKELAELKTRQLDLQLQAEKGSFILETHASCGKNLQRALQETEAARKVAEIHRTQLRIVENQNTELIRMLDEAQERLRFLSVESVSRSLTQGAPSDKTLSDERMRTRVAQLSLALHESELRVKEESSRCQGLEKQLGRKQQEVLDLTKRVIDARHSLDFEGFNRFVVAVSQTLGLLSDESGELPRDLFVHRHLLQEMRQLENKLLQLKSQHLQSVQMSQSNVPFDMMELNRARRTQQELTMRNKLLENTNAKLEDFVERLTARLHVAQHRGGIQADSGTVEKGKQPEATLPVVARTNTSTQTEETACLQSPKLAKMAVLADKLKRLEEQMAVTAEAQTNGVDARRLQLLEEEAAQHQSHIVEYSDKLSACIEDVKQLRKELADKRDTIEKLRIQLRQVSTGERDRDEVNMLDVQLESEELHKLRRDLARANVDLETRQELLTLAQSQLRHERERSEQLSRKVSMLQELSQVTQRVREPPAVVTAAAEAQAAAVQEVQRCAATIRDLRVCLAQKDTRIASLRDSILRIKQEWQRDSDMQSAKLHELTLRATTADTSHSASVRINTGHRRQSMQRQIEQQKHTIAKLESTLEKAQDEEAALRDQLSAQETKLEQTHSELRTQKNALRDKDRQLLRIHEREVTLRRERDDCKSRLRRATAKLATLRGQKKLESSEAKEMDTPETQDKTDDAGARLEADKTSSKETNLQQRREKERERTLALNRRLQKRLNSLEAELDSTRQQLAEKQALLSKQKGRVEEATRQANAATEETQRLRDELRRFKRDFSFDCSGDNLQHNYEGRLRELTGVILQQRSENTHASREIDQLRRVVGVEHAQQLQKLRDENESLRRALALEDISDEAVAQAKQHRRMFGKRIMDELTPIERETVEKLTQQEELIETLEDRMSQLQCDNIKKCFEAGELTARLERTQTMLRESETLITSLKQALDRSWGGRIHLAQLRERYPNVAELKCDDDVIQVLTGLRTVITTLEEEKDELRKKAAERKKFVILMKEHKELQDKFEKNQSTLAEHQDKLREATDKVDSLQKRWRNETRRRSAANDNVQVLQRELTLAKGELEEVRRYHESTQRELEQRLSDVHQSAVDDFRTKLAERDDMIQKLHAQLSEVRDSLARRDSSSKHDLQQTLQHKDARIEELSKEVQQLKKQLSALSDANDAMREELAAFDEDFFEEITQLKERETQFRRRCRELETYALSLEEVLTAHHIVIPHSVPTPRQSSGVAK